MLYNFALVLILQALHITEGKKVQVLEEHAIDTILDGYQKFAYPGTAEKPKVRVDHSLLILGIDYFDYTKLVIDAWINMAWNDPRFTWKEQPTHVRIPPSAIWKPDVILYRGATSYKNAGEVHATVAQNGHVLYYPQVQLETKDCNFSKNGTIACTFKFGSWTYSGAHLNLVVGHGGIDMSYYRKSGKFEIVRQTAVRNEKKYACCPEKYVDVTYTLEIRPR